MKVGLINIDSKIPNLALMKISAFHKNQGDQVEFFKTSISDEYDLVYSSKIFTKSKNFMYSTKNNIIKGGCGYSLKISLPDNIEHIYPDYNLFNINYAMGYLTRGCINNCPFCIVPEKEGILRKNADLEEFWTNQKKVFLFDNSLTDYKDAIKELTKIRDLGIRLDLNQGFNVRTLTREKAKLISEIKLWRNKSWKFAWDNIKDEKRVFKGIEYLHNTGLDYKHQMMCYILVGYNSNFEEDKYRVLKIHDLGIFPYVMTYSESNLDPRTKILRTWSNNVYRRNAILFEDFLESKMSKIKKNKLKFTKSIL